MSFELKTEIQRAAGQDILVLLMRVNSDKDEDWCHCAFEYKEYKDKDEAWGYLAPMLKSVINIAYEPRKEEVNDS